MQASRECPYAHLQRKHQPSSHQPWPGPITWLGRQVRIGASCRITGIDSHEIDPDQLFPTLDLFPVKSNVFCLPLPRHSTSLNH